MEFTKGVCGKGKVLYADLLQPSDVVLSSMYEVKHRVIVSATKKRDSARCYSHAAFVLQPAEWLESNIEGTGITYQKVGTVQWEPGGPIRRVIDVSHYRIIDVWRMPNIDPERLTIATPQFRAIVESVIGFEYPPLDALANATDWLRRFPNLKLGVLKRVSKLTRASRRKVINPGNFCSQLIVEVFNACKKAGLVPNGVLTTDAPSRNISSNDLGDPRISRLVLIDGFVESRAIKVQAEDTAADIGAITYGLDDAWERAGKALKQMIVHSKRDRKALSEFSAVVNEKTLEMWSFLAETLREGNFRLAFTNDEPFIEDHPNNPRLRQVQEQALKAGLNPGWLRLEGLGFMFKVSEDQCTEEIRSFAITFATIARAWTSTPLTKLGASARLTDQWVLQCLDVFKAIKRSLDEMHCDEDRYWWGFPSDVVMIGWINDMAGTFEIALQAFLDFLVRAVEACEGVSVGNPRAPIKIAFTTLIRDLRKTADVAQEILDGVHRLVAEITADHKAVPTTHPN